MIKPMVAKDSPGDSTKFNFLFFLEISVAIAQMFAHQPFLGNCLYLTFHIIHKN